MKHWNGPRKTDSLLESRPVPWGFETLIFFYFPAVSRYICHPGPSLEWSVFLTFIFKEHKEFVMLISVCVCFLWILAILILAVIFKAHFYFFSKKITQCGLFLNGNKTQIIKIIGNKQDLKLIYKNKWYGLIKLLFDMMIIKSCHLKDQNSELSDSQQDVICFAFW